MLDLFSGMGGASEAMKDRGWEVIRLDIKEKFKPDLVGDIKRLPLKEYKPDLIWGSRLWLVRGVCSKGGTDDVQKRPGITRIESHAHLAI